MAKVSIILPVYNVEKYIRLCIESILSQSFTDFELIIINDGSEDNSGEICEEYEKKDRRIKLIHQENKGLSMARNKGIEISKGEYISFIDSDDYIHQDTMKLLYNNLIENKADISTCDYRLVYEDYRYEDQEVVNNITLLTNVEALNMILDDSATKMIIAVGKLYSRSLFEGIRYPRGKYHEDEFVTYKLLYKARRVVLTDASLYYYTQREDSITGDKYSLKRLEKLEGLKEAIDFFEELNEAELKEKAEKRYLLNIQIGYYKVKYELVDKLEGKIKIMDGLKEKYDCQYKKIDFSIFQGIIFKAFYISPNLYCRLVKILIKIHKVLTFKRKRGEVE